MKGKLAARETREWTRKAKGAFAPLTGSAILQFVFIGVHSWFKNKNASTNQCEASASTG